MQRTLLIILVVLFVISVYRRRRARRGLRVRRRGMVEKIRSRGLPDDDNLQ